MLIFVRIAEILQKIMAFLRISIYIAAIPAQGLKWKVIPSIFTQSF